MPTADGGENGPRDWKRKEGLGSALTQIGVVAVLLAAAVYFYVQRGRVRDAVAGHLQAAREHAQRGNPEDLHAALKELDALFALDANAYDANVLAADLLGTLWMEHRVVSAEGRMREHLQRAENQETPGSGRNGTQVVRARMLLHEGKADEALSALEALESQGAGNARLWLVLARAQQARGQLVEARQTFTRAMEAAWKDPRYATAYGRALLDEGLHAQAAEALNKATTANPSHVEARLVTALNDLYQRQKEDAARETVREVSARGTELTPALEALLLTVRAELALARGAPDEALREAGAALVLAPDSYHALFARARALAAKQDAEGARAALVQAVGKRGTAPLLYLDGARTLREVGDSEGALSLLDRYETAFRDVTVAEGKTASALERDDRYWLARGGVLEALGRQDEALAAYDKALAPRGLHLGRAQYAKAALLLARKDYAGARSLLEPLTPEDGSGRMAEAYTAMGDVLLAGGDTQAGVRYYLRGLQRAKALGVPPEQLRARADELGQRLKAVRPALAKEWADATGPVLQAQ